MVAYVTRSSYLRGEERVPAPSSVSLTPGSLGVVYHTEAVRLQADASCLVTWTFDTEFSASPIISVCPEGTPASLGAGFMPANLIVITALSTTAVSFQTNQPSVYFHATATDAT